MFPFPFFDPSMFMGAAMPAIAPPTPPAPMPAAAPPPPPMPAAPPMAESIPNMTGPSSMSPSAMPPPGAAANAPVDPSGQPPGQDPNAGQPDFMKKIQQANDQGAYRQQAAQRALRGMQNRSQTPQKKQAPAQSMNTPTTEAQRRAQAGGAPTLEYKANLSQDMFGGELPPWMDPNKPIFG